VVSSTTVDLTAIDGTATTQAGLEAQLNGAGTPALPGGTFQFNSDNQLEINNPFGPGNNFAIRQNPDNPGTIEASNLAATAKDTDGDGNGERNFSHFFGFNNLFQTPDTGARDSQGNTLSQPASNPDLVTGDTSVGGTNAKTSAGVSAASVIEVKQSIVDDPAKFARISPKVTPGTTALPIGDPTVAQKMAAAFDEKVQFAAPATFEDNNTTAGDGVTFNPTGGNIGSRQVTLSEFAGDIAQFQAQRTSDLESSVEAKGSVQEQLQLRADSASGVNIDQELANLANFQQAFNANARMISVVDEMFDTLNQMAR
jgi:flagellar hook-associated protein 1 FlgK